MVISHGRLRAGMVLSGVVLLAACAQGPVDWDLRSGLNTGAAATNAASDRPQPDARGVISYPTYQVAVARQGDTVTSLAQRVGADAGEIARFNAIAPDTVLRGGEVLALPSGAAAQPAVATAPVSGLQTSAIEVTSLDPGSASAPTPTQAPTSTASSGAQPAQHRVQRGETAYSIARTYNISPRVLADWNGLDSNLSLREGQVLLIPVDGAQAPATPASASAATPAPATTPAAAAPAPSSSRLAMPASGSILRPYSKGKNEGIDIGAAAGSPVVAAESGTVAAITRDTDQVPIVVLRHDNNLLTVYAGIDNVTVERGASVSRGQQFATVRNASPAFLHFEVRNGFESVDPAPYLP
ncbi:M23 family metallopeptidase [Falsirhodobacter algicola]|uniref:Peptidoglycan DD-metalloendopeptidase family protein n=1 Tax=Falsirhodobacter algicola TaxID=2692330 RepID=A0A8J8MSC5_9RHOB|nr:M23 family metallopeptidase [Falsirhodobacter algicola]QUS35496.1 peptidoglycan DD-metalloendopeptidase family protein [Falsirhodobacter algicola]